MKVCSVDRDSLAVGVEGLALVADGRLGDVVTLGDATAHDDDVAFLLANGQLGRRVLLAQAVTFGLELDSLEMVNKS